MEVYPLTDYLTQEQQTLAQELARLVDPWSFGKVVGHLRNPRTETTQIVLVSPGFEIAEVGAIMVSGGIPQLSVVLAMGGIQYGLDGAKRGGRYTVPLCSIHHMSACQVLYLPPAYLVQLDPS